MTCQVLNFNKKKRELQDMLNSQPSAVRFLEPTMVRDVRFTGDTIKVGHSFPVVMDHPKRSRFAMITRTDKGFRVT